ncbi:MAG: VOC family protein [Egibacteraceae bacterium]
MSHAFFHAAITCNDPLNVERWYRKHFGFERARVYAVDPPIVMIKANGTYLEIFQATQAAPVAEPEGSGYEWPSWRHLAFHVDDLDAKLAEMGDEAVVKLGPIDFGQFVPGMRAAWIADPEGNIVELNQGYRDEDDPPPLPDV